MSLTTVADVKTQLSIASTNLTRDVMLGLFLRTASAQIREYCGKYLGGVVTSISVAAAAVINAPGHGLQTGDLIQFYGTDSTPSLDTTGTTTNAVTWLSEDTFSVPTTTTVAGTKGYWAKQYTEYYSADNTQVLQLKQSPVISISDLRYDEAGHYGRNTANGYVPFDTPTILTEGTDWDLDRNNANQTEQSLTGRVFRLNGYWPAPIARRSGRLTLEAGRSTGNIKVTYIAGFVPMRANYQAAARQFVVILQAMRKNGKLLTAEGYDYYHYQLAPEKDQDNAFGGVRSLLGKVKEWVF